MAEIHQPASNLLELRTAMLNIPDICGLLPHLPNVAVRSEAVVSYASQIEGDHLRLPTWRGPAFPVEDSEDTAGLLVVANAVNFSFWGDPKWTVHHREQALDGSLGLFSAFTRAAEAGVPILHGAYLASLSAGDLHHLLRGSVEIPMFETRLQILRETGRVLLKSYGGNPLNLIRAAGGDALGLVRLLTDDFPSFNDSARYRNLTLSFHKRAQFVAAMLYARFRGQRWGAFRNIDRLTLFADYKLPQVLRELGILTYSPRLAERVDLQVQIPAGSPEEIQIRLATLTAGEALRRALRPRFPHITAVHIDGLLWTAAQDSTRPMRPYHRTRTPYY